MMRNGLRPNRYDHRDYDFLKSHQLGALPVSDIPDFNFDAGLWMPDQRLPNDIFHIPGQPFGCTNFTSDDICADEDGQLYNPGYTESLTHANANGGAQLRDSLDTLIKYGVQRIDGTIGFKRTAYFNVRAQQPFDWFDAFTLAMYSALPEKRPLSVGTPYFLAFEYIGSDGILPMIDVPKELTLTGIPALLYRFATIFSRLFGATPTYTWHNYKICGKLTINGVPYLICKTWQGMNYGRNGYALMSRELCNTLFSIPYTAAYVVTKQKPDEIQTVDLDVVARIVSVIRHSLGL